jgi:hypothetical protein
MLFRSASETTLIIAHVKVCTHLLTFLCNI